MRQTSIVQRAFRPALVGLLFLVVVLLLASNRSFADGAADALLLETVHKKESAFWQSMQREEQEGFLDRLSNLLVAERKLISLTVEGKVYGASSAYLATELKNKFECIFMVADDTIHTTESLDFITVPWKPGQKLKVHTVWSASQVESIEFYTGDPSEMHQNGYKNVHKVPFDPRTGLLDYKPSYQNHHQLLFAILKPKNDKYYRKFVFVVGALQQFPQTTYKGKPIVTGDLQEKFRYVSYSRARERPPACKNV